MNLPRECKKRVDAYWKGYSDAMNNRGNHKSKFKKTNQRAYKNGYTEGQQHRTQIKVHDIPER